MLKYSDLCVQHSPVINTFRFITWMQICGMVLEIRIKGIFDSSFHASESSTSSDKEQDGIGEKSNFWAGVKRLKIVPK